MRRLSANDPKVLVVGGALALVVFAFGVVRLRSAEASLRHALAEARSTVDRKEEAVRTWTPVTTEESRTWEAIDRLYAWSVPARDERLAASLAFSRLVVECGLEDVSVVETGDPDAGSLEDAAWADEPDWEEDESWEDEEWDDVEDAVTESDDIASREYTIRFTSGFDGVVRFVDGLARLNRLVELRRAVVHATPPGVRAELIVATFFRQEAS